MTVEQITRMKNRDIEGEMSLIERRAWETWLSRIDSKVDDSPIDIRIKELEFKIANIEKFSKNPDRMKKLFKSELEILRNKEVI